MSNTDFVASIKWGNSLVPNAELIFNVFEGAEHVTRANIAGLAASNRHHYRFLSDYIDDLLLMQILRFNYSQKVPAYMRFNLVTILNNSGCAKLVHKVDTYTFSPEEWEEEKVHMSRDYILDLIDTDMVNIDILRNSDQSGNICLKSKIYGTTVEAPFSCNNQEIDPILIEFIKKYGGIHVKNYLTYV